MKEKSNVSAKSITLMALLMSAILASAVPMFPFLGWQTVKGESPDIVVARCVKAPDQPSRHSFALNSSDIQILYALKGRTNLGPARLGSVYWPRDGECYLLFSEYHDDFYQAGEPVSSRCRFSLFKLINRQDWLRRPWAKGKRGSAVLLHNYRPTEDREAQKGECFKRPAPLVFDFYPDRDMVPERTRQMKRRCLK